jgi:hypothetical protein
MPSRYQAPKHVTGVHTSAGNEYRADKNGIITVPDTAPAGDHVSLCSAGWMLISQAASKADSEGPSKPASPKRKRSSKPAQKAKPAVPAGAPDTPAE